MDNPDQEILYAIRDEISQQQLSMNNAGLALGTGNAVLDSSRAQWQAEPDSVITLSAVQLAAALAAAKYQALQHAYQVAQDAVTRSNTYYEGTHPEGTHPEGTHPEGNRADDTRPEFIPPVQP